MESGAFNSIDVLCIVIVIVWVTTGFYNPINASVHQFSVLSKHQIFWIIFFFRKNFAHKKNDVDKTITKEIDKVHTADSLHHAQAHAAFIKRNSCFDFVIRNNFLDD